MRSILYICEDCFATGNTNSYKNILLWSILWIRSVLIKNNLYLLLYTRVKLRTCQDISSLAPNSDLTVTYQSSTWQWSWASRGLLTSPSKSTQKYLGLFITPQHVGCETVFKLYIINPGFSLISSVWFIILKVGTQYFSSLKVAPQIINTTNRRKAQNSIKY